MISVREVCVVFWCATLASAHLNLQPTQCGNLKCDILDFCSEYSHICVPCSNICNETHNNADLKKCEANCQNYLHEIRFQKSTNSNPDQDLRAEVIHLRHMVSVLLGLTCLILVALAAATALKLCKWETKHRAISNWIRRKLTHKEKPSAPEKMAASQPCPELRLDMPAVLQVSCSPMDTPPSAATAVTTVTTVSSRRPTEDSTLDYAYDNPAMVGHSPPGPQRSNPHESSL